MNLSGKRLIVGVLGALVLLWVISTIVGFFGSPEDDQLGKNVQVTERPGINQHSDSSHMADSSSRAQKTESHATPNHDNAPETPTASYDMSSRSSEAETPEKTAEKLHIPKLPEDTHLPSPKAESSRPGVALTQAIIEPMRKELEERWWGWRPNDIINLTDNVDNFQLGVLEVTRRAVVALADRLARTGSASSYDPNLENAMNWFMVKADAYWFPTPESKYKEGLQDLASYKRRLENGQGNFYTRSDNLIPMLSTFEDLLGSCDENLVKEFEDDGTKVSFFKADDYFYYAKGVASAMHGILEAIHVDFEEMVHSRGATEVLHHAILSCHHAAVIDPWLILNSDLSSIFANHRANMAAPISHARYYLGVLIKVLST